MRAVALPAGDNGFPRPPAELALGDALTEVQGPVRPADAPDLGQREVRLGGAWGGGCAPGLGDASAEAGSAWVRARLSGQEGDGVAVQ